MTVGPFYLEIYGDAGMGKTHQSHMGSPQPIHFDTASTEMDFGDYEIEANPDRKGESWDVIHKKVYNWDDQSAEASYRYIKSYEQAVDELSELEGFETVILDNFADFKTLCIDHLVKNHKNSKLVQGRGWPTQSGWGKVGDYANKFLDSILETGRHLVVISEMKKEYVDGEYTGDQIRDGPKKAHFDADFRIKLEEISVEGQPRRQATVMKNRWLDRYSDQWVESIGSEYDFGTLMAISGIPDDEW